MRKRVLCFVFDGTGLGHLKRMSNIASRLNERFIVLLVTGMKEAAWLAPPECGLLLLPSTVALSLRDNSLAEPGHWIGGDTEVAMQIRRGLLRAAIRQFSPDAIVNDYLPFGRHGELRTILSEFPGRKYLVHRGIADKADDFLKGAELTKRTAEYDRIFVANSLAVVDTPTRDAWDEVVRAKATFVGLIGEHGRTETRSKSSDGSKFLNPTSSTIVCCSVGGGWLGEHLIRYCVALAAQNTGCIFYLQTGTMNNWNANNCQLPKNCVVLPPSSVWSAYLRTADIAICHGGYNSLVEGIAAGARLIAFPSRSGDEDEQRLNAIFFGAHYPVSLVSDYSSLAEAFASAVEASKREHRPVFPFDMNGASRIASIIKEDLDEDGSSLTS